MKQFSNAELQMIYRILLSTWDEIAYDCLAATAEAGEGDTMCRSAVIEVVLDANYADHHARGREQREVYEQFKSLSYDEQKEIAKGCFKHSHYCM